MLVVSQPQGTKLCHYLNEQENGSTLEPFKSKLQFVNFWVIAHFGVLGIKPGPNGNKNIFSQDFIAVSSKFPIEFPVEASSSTFVFV